MNKSKAKMGKPSTPQNSSGNCNVAVTSRNTPPSRNKSDKDIPYEGIYQNLRFCETITSLMGNTVQIQLSNGKIFEGIFSTFSPQLEVVLELVHTVDPSQPDKIDVKSVSREVVFGSQMIVMMSSKDVELDYATKDFATDTSISRFNGLSGEKELEPWEGDGDDCNISLDNANGWDPNEMFARNEKVYGVQTSFVEDLSQYTCKLERRDSAEFKEREAQASLLANSIEGNAVSKAQADLENASDEEEKFSAVVRPNHEPRERREPRDFRDFSNRSSDRGGTAASGSGGSTASTNAGGGSAHNSKYVHPNKRPIKSGIQNMGKMVRSTPPPHGAHGGHAHSNLAPRHQSVGGGGGGGSGSGSGSYHGGNNYDGDGRTSQSHPNNSGSVHHAGGSYHQGGPQHQPFQGSSQGRGSSSGPYYGRSQGPPGGYNNNKNSAQQSDSRVANGDERKVIRDSAYDSKSGHAPSHSHVPVSSLPQRDHGPKEQRKTYAGKTRDDQNSDLKKFGQDFRLALSGPAESTPVEENKAAPSPTTGNPAPTPNKTSTPPPPAPVAPVISPASGATSALTPAAPTAPVATPSAQTVPAQPSRSPVVSPVQVNSTPTVVTPPGASVGTPREATPVEDKVGESVEKMSSDTLKKSSLNPNAKEFVLNPNARVFVPTPPRSHTPQTQQSGQMLIPAPMGQLGPSMGGGMGGSGSPAQGLPLMPVVHYVQANAGGVQNQGPNQGGNQPHYASHNPGGTRFRKPSPMPVNHRPDLASSMHVAAATGQPLMAPAPISGQQIFYPPQGAMMQGTPQPYTQLYAMRLVGPQMQGMVSNSSYGDTMTTGHGPIYMTSHMSPGHGQGMNNQGQMAPSQQQQHHHPNSTPSPAQQHSMAQTQAGNPPQLIYQTAGGHHGHSQGPLHSHHAPYPMVLLPPGHTQLPPGVSGPSVGPGGPQGVQLLPLGSSAAMGMPIPQIHYIQQAPGNQALQRLV